MKKLLALISARNKEFYRDRSSLIWTLLFPFIVLAGFRYGYSGRQDPLIRIMALPPSSVSSPMIQNLQSTPGIELKTTDHESTALKKLEHYETDLVISMTDQGNRVAYFLNQDSDKGKLSERLLMDVVERQSLSKP